MKPQKTKSNMKKPTKHKQNKSSGSVAGLFWNFIYFSAAILFYFLCVITA